MIKVACTLRAVAVTGYLFAYFLLCRLTPDLPARGGVCVTLAQARVPDAALRRPPRRHRRRQARPTQKAGAGHVDAAHTASDSPIRPAWAGPAPRPARPRFTKPAAATTTTTPAATTTATTASATATVAQPTP